MPIADHSPPPGSEGTLAARAAAEQAWMAERAHAKKLFDLWRRPEGRFPWVTLLIVLASVGVAAWSFVSRDSAHRLLFATGPQIWLEGKWWGLLGAVLIHGGPLHLVFNCYWVWLLGRLVERELGPARHLGLFLAAAWLGSVAELSWSGQPGVGLSGVVYAFFGFLYVNRSRHRDFALVLNRDTVLLLFGWLIACFPLTYAKFLNVANFGHVGGLVAGGVLGLAAYPGKWQGRARVAALALGFASFVPLLWAPWHDSFRAKKPWREPIRAGAPDR